MSIRWKFTVSALLAVTLGLAVAGWLALRSIERLELARLHESLDTRTGLAALVLEPLLRTGGGRPTVELRSAARAVGAQALARVTVIDRTGTVLADTETPDAAVGGLENHATRPEVASALAGARGMDVRLSQTTGKRMSYVAFPVRGPAGDVQAVIRLALPLTEVDARIQDFQRALLLAFGVALMAALGVGVVLARGLTRPFPAMAAVAQQLAAGHVGRRIPVGTSDEIGVLATTFNQMADRLEATIRELTEDRARLRQLESIRKDFVANVSHELRTPLTSIKGYVEALLDDGMTDRETAERFLRIALTQADRLNLILDDLLQLSQIESGQVRLKEEPVSLPGVVDRTLAVIKPMADKKGHTVTVDIPPTVPSLLGDEPRLVQVMTNLLDNAVKYTPDRGQIHISARTTAGLAPEAISGRPSVEVSVADTGIGIPDADRPRVFERFYRVDKARSRELGGTGLGLAIVKHIVEGHQGQVWVQPNTPRGSRFMFRLPSATG
jgi:signal transduction histidine kinase